jgi:ubiquinone/menaquinone biosynthesis C-methylase UbiE
MTRTQVLKMLAPLLLITVAAGFAAAGDVVVEPREERLNQRQPPLQVMDAISLKPGMTIADIGAGRGRYTVWFAQRVGPEGKVYANDIDRESLAHLRRRCEAQGLANVEAVLGQLTDPKLPAGAIDIVFMINVYHHLADPVRLVRKALPGLRPGGVVAIVECDPSKDGFDPDHGTPKAKMLRQLGEAGLVGIEVIDPAWLKDDYIYVGRPGGE